MSLPMPRCTPIDQVSAPGTLMFGSNTLTSSVTESVIGYTGVCGKGGAPSLDDSRSSTGVVPRFPLPSLRVVMIRMPGLELYTPV